MRRHGLLRGLHRVLQPRTYLEVGVRNGLSLTLSRARSIAVDPFFSLDKEVRCDLHLVRTTSDEFFARPEPLAHFDEPVIDLAFIDGMHLSEFALRDFLNIERYCHAGSVVVLDDVLPRSVVEAGRGREGSARRGAWAGDVYKVVDTLRELRPDLVVVEVDSFPTGTLVVLNPDPRSRVLLQAYDDLVSEYVVPDPQAVPEATLRRSRAVDGQRVLDAPDWPRIRGVRGMPHDRAHVVVADLLRQSGLATGAEEATRAAG